MGDAMNVEREVKQIKKRNERVELDKRWETSWTRRIVILALTFVVVLIFNYLVSQQVNIIFSSLVPVIGFFLSTLSLGAVRRIWEKRTKLGKEREKNE
jgi:predicted Co/Zn/Cd cation transporter (cation efflux family)